MSADAPTPFRRVLLKLSGECFSRPGEQGISVSEALGLAEQLKAVVASGTQLAVVCGGGNILRGKTFAEASGRIPEQTAHYMGMLATAINALALQELLESIDVPTRVQSAIEMDKVAEPFIRRRCIRHLEKGRVVILAGGTGLPFVTTDTAAAQRAREIEAEVVLKATTVDGVYSDDPKKNPHAVRYTELSFDDAIEKRLKVMDAQAFQHCTEAGIPILVFDYRKEGNIGRAVRGEPVGTRVG
ncbi:MAG: UMP kinase [Planctomycetota bacterium]